MDAFRIARDLGLMAGFQADLRREQINVYTENMLTVSTQVKTTCEAVFRSGYDIRLFFS